MKPSRPQCPGRTFKVGRWSISALAAAAGGRALPATPCGQDALFIPRHRDRITVEVSSSQPNNSTEAHEPRMTFGVACRSSGLSLAAVGLAAGICLMMVGPVGWIWVSLICAFLVAGFAVPVIALGTIRFDLTPPLERMVASRQSEWAMLFRRHFPWPLYGVRLHIGDQVIPFTLRATQPGVSPIAFTAARRGVIHEEQVRLETSYPFNLWTARRGVTMTRRALVWPQIEPVPRFHFPTMSGADGERVIRASPHGDLLGVRDYRRGDSPRQMAWTAFARFGRLIAKQRGAAPEQEILIILDESAFAGAIEAPNSGYEYAIRTAASLVLGWAGDATRLSVALGRKLHAVPSAMHAAAVVDEIALLPRAARTTVVTVQRPPSAFVVFLTAEGQGPHPHPLECVIRFTRGAIEDAPRDAADPSVIATHGDWLNRLHLLGHGRGQVCVH